MSTYIMNICYTYRATFIDCSFYYLHLYEIDVRIIIFLMCFLYNTLQLSLFICLHIMNIYYTYIFNLFIHHRIYYHILMYTLTDFYSFFLFLFQ